MDGDFTTWIPIITSMIAAVAAITVTIIQVNSKRKQVERDKRDKAINEQLGTIGVDISGINTLLEENRLDDATHKTDYNAFKETTNNRLEKIEKKVFR